MIPKQRLAFSLSGLVFLGMLALQWASLEHLIIAFNTIWSETTASGVAATVVFANAALAAWSIINRVPRLQKVMFSMVTLLCLVEVAVNVLISAGALAENLPAVWGAFFGLSNETMWRVAAFLLASWPPIVSLGMTFLFSESVASFAREQNNVEGDEAVSVDDIARYRRPA